MSLWKKSSRNLKEVTPLPKELSEEIYIELVKLLSEVRKEVLIFRWWSPAYSEDKKPAWMEINDRGYKRLIQDPKLYKDLKNFFKNFLPEHNHFFKYGEGSRAGSDLELFLKEKMGVSFDDRSQYAITEDGKITHMDFMGIAFAFMRKELDFQTKKNLCELRKCDDEDAEKFFEETKEEIMKQEKFKKAFDKRDLFLKEIDELSDRLVELHKKNIEYPQKLSEDMRNATKKAGWGSWALVVVTIGLIIAAIYQKDISDKLAGFEEYRLTPQIYPYPDECPGEIEILANIGVYSKQGYWSYPKISNAYGSPAICRASIKSAFIKFNKSSYSSVLTVGGISTVHFTYDKPLNSPDLDENGTILVNIYCTDAINGGGVYNKNFPCNYERDINNRKYVLQN